MMNSADIWVRVLERLEKHVKLWELHQWFDGSALLQDGSTSIVVGVPSDAHRRFIRKHFTTDIRDALRAEGRTGGTITFEVCDVGRSEIRPNLRSLVDFQSEPISWLWPGRIAARKLTLIVGDPGLGKSWIAQDVAARISAGNQWPDRTPGARGTVILLDAENGIRDTVRPRIEVMGGELKRVHVLETVGSGEHARGITLNDIDSLRVAIDRVQARLVVIDPISAYLGSTDSHRDAEVRALLGPLQKLAEATNVAIVGVMHRAKGAARDSVLSACGSIAFTAAARVVLLVARDPDVEGRRMFGPLKTNLSDAPAGLAYRLTNSGVRWERGALARFDAGALLACDTVDDRTEQTDAEEILRRLLKKATTIDAREAVKLGAECFITPITMRRASRKLGLRSKRVGGAASLGKWVWVGPKAGS
jgi:putative DNA primase/helicase